MKVPYPPRTRGGTRAAYSLLCVCVVFATVVGGILGPWLLPPTSSQASALSDEINAIAIGKAEQSDFSPDSYATYGEVITYSLHFTVGQGMHSSIVITDTFGDPSNSTYLPVTPTNFVGPIPLTPGAPDPSDVTPVVTWPVGRAGRPVVKWTLLESINNTSGQNWVFEIRYRALVWYDGNTQSNRKIRSTPRIDWAEGGPVTGADNLVTLVQPLNFTLNKSQVPNTELNPNQSVTWTINMRNPTGSTQSTAYDLAITDTMPTRTVFDSVTVPPTATWSQNGNRVYVSMPYLKVATTDTYIRVRAHVPGNQNLAHGTLLNKVDLYRSSAPGPVPEERAYYTNAQVQGYIRNIDLTKSATSKTYYQNTASQAVGGEYVTVTVNVGIPRGLVVYDPVVRILLRDGLSLSNVLGTTPYPDDTESNPNYQDPAKPSGYWTQYEWNQLASITNTNTSPVTLTFSLRAQARHLNFNPYNPDFNKELANGVNLEIVPVVRWAPSEGGDVYEGTQCDSGQPGLCKRNTGTPAMQFIRPDLRYQSPTSGSYFTTAGSFQGGGTINFTLHLRNQTSRPTAYDTVLIENLSPGLEYVAANPPPAGVVTGTAGTTITWNVSTPISNNTLLFDVQAQLPVSMAVGFAVTNTAHARYTTFPGTGVPNEGQYYDAPPASPPYTARVVLQGGFVPKKYVTPTDNVKIGDGVNYTLVITVNPGMIMYMPTFADTLPKGFHYVDDSFWVAGGDLLTGSLDLTGTGAPNYAQLLSWGLLTVDNRSGAQPRVITMHYQGLLKGLDFRAGEDGLPVYASSRNDLVNRLTARNTVSVCWSEGPGEAVYCLADTAEPYAETKIVQPYLADSPPWSKTRTDPTNTYEVGDDVYFVVTFRNTGQGTAYETILEDVLPQGIAFKDTILTVTPPDPPVGLLNQPAISATGTISWTLDHIAPGQSVELGYRTTVITTALPSILLTNLAEIVDYTSQPTDPEYDRHYAEFDGDFVQDPIPPPVSCPPFYVLGVGVRKTDMVDPVAPGENLTYTVYFSNTSGRFGAVNVRITDTYDPNLTYLGAAVSDQQIHFVGFFGPYSAVWQVDSMPNNDPHQYWIRPFFRVVEPFDPAQSPLVNQAGIDGLNDKTGPVWRTEETTVKMPILTIRKSGNPLAVAPGEQLVYTIRFTNTTTYNMTATNVLIQELYDPHVTFVSSIPDPLPGTTDQWQWADLPEGASGSIQVTVQVQKPVPAGVLVLINSARISCTEVLAVTSPEYQTALNVPVLSIGTTDFPDPVNPGNPLRYTIVYANDGNLAATDTVFTNTLDPYVTFVSAIPSPIGGTCPGNICTWPLYTLNPGSQSSIQLDVQVNSSIPGGVTRLTNVGTMASAEVGPSSDVEYTDLPHADVFGIFLPLVARGYAP